MSTVTQGKSTAGHVVARVFALAFGLATILVSGVYFPAGAILVVFALMLAVTFKGADRTILLIAAAAGCIVCLLIALGLTSAAKVTVYPSAPQVGEIITD